MDKDHAIKQIIYEYQNGLPHVECALNPSECDQIMNHYLSSYCSLLKVSQYLCSELNETDKISQKQVVMAIAHMAYGWMRQPLKKCDINDEIKHVKGKTILNALDIKTCDDAVEFVCGYSRSPINGSCIGLSKALHFINPEIFPIWDSNVAKAFGIKGYHYQMQDIQKYKCYVEFCHEILCPNEVKEVEVRKAVKQVQESFLKKRNDKVSKIRALEFIWFTTNR